MKDWKVQAQFKNLAKYELPFESISYISRTSNPGTFTVATVLNAETMDILRGSEITFLYKGEPRFSGKIVNKKPLFDSGIIEFQGIDWNGILFDRQIAFQGYDESVYSYAGADYWDWDVTKPPGKLVEVEGSALIKLLLKHYCGSGVTSTLSELGLYGFYLDNIEAGLTKKPWRFEGESLGESFSKIASVMECSTMRFGFNWWVDAHKRFWLRRYGDSIYNKELKASWSPPEEDSSSVMNHIHLIGGIATPFPDNREQITDYHFDYIRSWGENSHTPPTSASKGWGCWSRRSTTDISYIDLGQLDVDDTYNMGYVTGLNKSAVCANIYKASAGGPHTMTFGIYYEINNQYSEFKDNAELRDWSDRNQNSDRKRSSIRTLTFYFRQDAFDQDLCCAKLKIYTNSATPTFPPSNTPATDVYEEDNGVFDLDITSILQWYRTRFEAESQQDWIRVLIVFNKGVNSDTYVNLSAYACENGGGGGSGIEEPPSSATGAYLDVRATWDVFNDKTLPDASDIWGFGIELAVKGSSGDHFQFGLDHIFFGFGEVEVQRRDDLSIAMLDREVEKWIMDRKCHSWSRAEHLADVLLDNLKYTQKSRTGTLSYYNPELRLNQLIPINEYGVEWMYVLEEMQVNVSALGTTQVIKVGTPRPDPDELFEFYQVEVASMQAAGSGKTVHDWISNTKCEMHCERVCEFSCLSDWSTGWKKGGSVCQTSHELTCVTCESVSELNPCMIACLKYSEIARIVQRPPLERSAVESTLLTAGPLVEAVQPRTKPITESKTMGPVYIPGTDKTICGAKAEISGGWVAPVSLPGEKPPRKCGRTKEMT